MIFVTCNCGQLLQIGDEFAGSRATCGSCGQILAIPAQRPRGTAPSAKRAVQRNSADVQNPGVGWHIPFWGWLLGGTICFLLLVCAVLLVVLINNQGSRKDSPAQQVAERKDKDIAPEVDPQVDFPINDSPKAKQSVGSKIDAPPISKLPVVKMNRLKQLIVGEWKKTSPGGNFSKLSFHGFGSLSVQDIALRFGTYSWVDDEHFDVRWTPPPPPPGSLPIEPYSERFRVSISGDEMALTLPGGVTYAYRREGGTLPIGAVPGTGQGNAGWDTRPQHKSACAGCKGTGRNRCHLCYARGLDKFCDLCGGSSFYACLVCGPERKCFACSGRGTLNSPCSACKGTGLVLAAPDAFGDTGKAKIRCNVCDGQRFPKCDLCQGRGKIGNSGR